MHASPSALDEAALHRLEQLGGNQLVGEMIDLFLVHGPRLIETAWAGWFAQDFAAIQRAIHSLKTSAGTLGAEYLRRLAQDFELALRTEALPQQVPERIEALNDGIQLAAIALRERRQGLYQPDWTANDPIIQQS
jgi:HPt (histidine-containing phosphotransfer) domain-containing protein